MSEPLIVERQDAMTILTVNLPEQRNALTGEPLFAAIEKAVASVNADPETRVVVLTATGSVFSAGGNVREMRDKTGMFAGRPDEITRRYRQGIQRIPLALDSLEVPSIAAVNGPAIGAGCDLALFCDVRIASTTAVFAESFAKLGIIPGDGGSWLLPRLVGWQTAALMAFTGDGLDAEEALARGLVARVVEPDKLMEEALSLAGRIASNPGQALRWTKQLMRASHGSTLRQALDMAGAMQGAIHHTPEHANALDSFFAGKAGDGKAVRG